MTGRHVRALLLSANVVAALALLPRVWRGLRAMSPRLVLAYCGIGAIVALHWLTFYGAIKLANASVAATCIALAPVFTAVIEPWVARRPFRPRELALGVAVPVLTTLWLSPLLAGSQPIPLGGVALFALLLGGGLLAYFILRARGLSPAITEARRVK